MNSIEKKRYKTELDRWILEGLSTRRCIATTLTFNPALISVLNKKTAKRSFKHYLNRVNRDLYGLADREGYLRLNVVAVTEGGEGVQDKTLHLHAIIAVPPNCDPDLLVRCLDANWKRVRGNGEHGEIEVCWDVEGWLNYVTKISSKTKYADDILFENISLGRNDSLPSARIIRLATRYPKPITGMQIPVNSVPIVEESNFASFLV